MKKLFLSLVTLLIFGACNRIENEVITQPESLSELELYEARIESKFKEAFSIAKRQKLLFKAEPYYNVGLYVFDPVKGLENISDSLNINIFGGSAKIISKSARISGTLNMPPPPTVDDIKDGLMSAGYQYNFTQRQMFNNFIDNLFSSSDAQLLQDANWHAQSFSFSVQNSFVLTTLQKKELLNYSAMIRAMCNYLLDGGLDEIYDGILSTNNSGSRIMRCSINTRSLLIAALVDGVVGAASGALVGAAGGTVTLPGVGTITGALGGAVFGGMAAITGSVVKGVVSQLIDTCTRNIQIADLSCATILHNFLVGNTATRTQIMQNNPHCFKIDDGALYVNTNAISQTESVIISMYQSVAFNY